jgi:hypothetical protein
MSGIDPHEQEPSLAPPGSGRSLKAAGRMNIALGLLIGAATAAGFLSDRLGGAESPFFVLVACLLVAVGAFVLAGRPVPVIILSSSLLFLGLFLGLGLLVGGSVLGAADGVIARAVGIGSLLLAALEAWSMLVAWRYRKRRMQASDVRGVQEEPVSSARP